MERLQAYIRVVGRKRESESESEGEHERARESGQSVKKRQYTMWGSYKTNLQSPS